MKIFVESDRKIESQEYIIKYGRGELAIFDTLQDAQQWQVDNLFKGSGGASYTWESINYEGTEAYEFAIYDENGNQLNDDISDGAGWVIKVYSEEDF